jgi:PAS domain S-box-containing protein
VLRAVGTCREIKDRPHGEGHLHLLEACISSLNDVVLIAEAGEIDEPAPRILFVNEAFERLTGYSSSEVLGRSPRFLQGANTDRVELERIRQALCNREPVRAELINYKKNGAEYWVELNIVPLVCTGGGLTHFVAIQRDITERKRGEEKLRESEQRFRQLTENINEVFWITDSTKEKMVYISPGYEKIWGRTCESLYASPKTWMEAIHPEDRERVAEAAMTRQVLGKYDETYRILRPDGTVRWIWDRAFPVTGENGEVIRIVGTAEDFTEKKKLEMQFLRTQRMESIGALAGGIAHDLNNVFAPIMMSIALLRSKVKDPEVCSVVDSLEASTRRGTDLVRQVVSFARGVDGRRVSVDLRHLGQEMESVIRETFPKMIEFESRIAKGLWPATGDPTQIYQVLMNLCVNARDAMPKGGKLKVTMQNVLLDEIYAGMNPEARPGSYVLIRVEDSGTGIPKELHEQIFDPFFTTKRVGQGTGLGLSTTMAIVKSHGGFIQVESELEQGSRFDVYFPSGAVPVSDEFAVKGGELPYGRGELVLVVDDEISIQNVAQKTLENCGYKVLVAANGVEAVSLYAQHRSEIRAVLLDMVMPFMDGPMTIAALKAINQSAKIIVSSGLMDNLILSKAVAEGIRHFMPKPYTAEDLLRTLRQAIEG